MTAFYNSLNQVDSIFSSKDIMLLNNRKNYLEIQQLLCLGASDTAIKLLCYLILMRTSQNWYKELCSNSGPKRFCHFVFMQFLFVDE